MFFSRKEEGGKRKEICFEADSEADSDDNAEDVSATISASNSAVGVFSFHFPPSSFLKNFGLRRMLTGASSSKAPMKRSKRASPMSSRVSRIKSSGNVISRVEFRRKIKKKATDYTEFHKLFAIFATY